MKYQTTKKQCQERIDKRKNVCDRCGRKIVPLKTVDNSGNPTYWSGCMHGTDSGHFTEGVSKEIYELAIKLVLEDGLNFGMSYEDVENYGFDYSFENSVSKTCNKISQMEYMKTNNPRYTKEQLEEKYKT